MNPLSMLFGAVVATRNRWYDTGRLKVERLQGPVISVGNISVGGTGKTPLVMALGRELASRGIRFDILSRGYRRARKGTLRLPEAADPILYGDEPALLQQELQVSVFVGNRRVEAGRLAEAECGPQLHLLDDGFQHRALHRDFDIVVLAPEDLDDELLPAGRLREPLKALGRADAIALPEEHHKKVFDFQGPIWKFRRRLVFDGELGAPALAFCGLGLPPRFFELLVRHNVDTRMVKPFADHHAYTEADLNGLLRQANSVGAELLVTTAKDAIKISRLPMPGEFMNRLRVARLVTEIVDAPQAMDAMLATLRDRCPGWFQR